MTKTAILSRCKALLEAMLYNEDYGTHDGYIKALEALLVEIEAELSKDGKDGEDVGCEVANA